MHVERITVSARRWTATRPLPSTIIDRLDPDAELYAAIVAGTRDYVREERLPQRRARPLRRHRFRAGRDDRRRRAGCRRRAHGRDAVGVLVGAFGQRRGRARRAPAHPPPGAADRRHRRRVPDPADADRPRRGEPAGTGARHGADGAVESVRPSHPHHRQQERARHRLLDPLRRQRGRLRAHQRRAEDAGLAALPLA